jgi:hypothetical protein
MTTFLLINIEDLFGNRTGGNKLIQFNAAGIPDPVICEKRSPTGRMQETKLAERSKVL